MKKLLFLFLLAGTIQKSAAQQTAFYNVTDFDTLVSTSVLYTPFSYVFAHEPEKYFALTIDIDELRDEEDYDFSKLVNLRSVHIQFTLCPDSSYEAKQRYIARVNSIISKHIACFAKCPKLDNIVFGIGEQIYLAKGQEQMAGREKRKYEKYRKRIIEQNLAGAWTQTGTLVQQKLPGIRLYAYDWGW